MNAITPTPHGFRWGPLEVVRVAQDKRGYVLRVGNRTISGYVEIRTSPKGQSGLQVKQFYRNAWFMCKNTAEEP